VDVYFCHHCQQSIPIKDLESGAAIRRSGRYYCATCKQLPREERSPLLIGILGFALLAALGVLAFQYGDVLGLPGMGTKKAEPGKVAETAKEPPVSATLAELRSEVVRSDETHRGRQQELDQRLKAIEDRWGAQAEKVNLVLGKLDLIDARFAESARQGTQLHRVEDQSKELSDRMRTLSDQVAALTAELQELKGQAARAEPPAPVPPVEEKPVPADPMKEEVRALLKDVKDRSPMKRFNAVAELAKYDAPEARAAVIAALRDEDFFVRRVAADLLGDSRSEEPIPSLIEALDDEEVSVRVAAHGALKKLTRKDLGFQENATIEERTRAKKKWKEWWDKKSGTGK
jgi:hypothetical protein